MAKRKFELPGIQDLSKEQEEARALPKEGQHLIIGGPGTGKSILALLRARRHAREDDDYLFLVFNHILNRASGQLFGNGFKSSTWDSWFREMFRQEAGQHVPLLPPQPNGYTDIDWGRVEEIIRAQPVSADGDQPFLVIDEGQDMPREFYSSLVSLGFERFFVVADQNQQIKEANSSRKDIQDCLAIETQRVIELRDNYRNQYPIAKLASTFYTGDPASPPPKLPMPRPGAVPILYTYASDDMDKVAGGILRLADRDPRQLIGVIAPKNSVRERYYRALRSVEVELDNSRSPVQTYFSESRPDISFDKGGILVINAQTCKGLEFDTVILADIDEHYHRPNDPDLAKRRFYVMVARARERVFMFKKRDGDQRIEAILPTDSALLRREKL